MTRPIEYICLPFCGILRAGLFHRAHLYAKAAAKIESAGDRHVISTVDKLLVDKYGYPIPTEWGEYRQSLARTLIAVSQTVGVVCIKGWEKDSGVQGEMKIAWELDKPVRMLNEQGEEIDAA